MAVGNANQEKPTEACATRSVTDKRLPEWASMKASKKLPVCSFCSWITWDNAAVPSLLIRYSNEAFWPLYLASKESSTSDKTDFQVMVALGDETLTVIQLNNEPLQT